MCLFALLYALKQNACEKGSKNERRKKSSTHLMPDIYFQAAMVPYLKPLLWIFGQFGSGSRVLMTKILKNLQLKKNYTFWIKILKLHFTYPQVSIKDVKIQDKSSSSKDNIQHFRTCNFLTFVGHINIFSLLDPDLHSRSSD